MSKEIKIQDIAYSKKWLKIYQYEKKSSGHKSSISTPTFFFAKDGIENPYNELLSAIDAFRLEKKVGLQNDYAQCVFPARYEFLQSVGLLRDVRPINCIDLNNWLKSVAPYDVSIVFSSAYPNNPASLFGHTFLTFGRQKENANQETKELLGYSFGYMANPDPTDNVVTYSIKGIVGGYYGVYEVKPYYVNVGMYNNGESRNLWEYKIPFNENERWFLLKYLYELSLNANHRYYFFDRNCAYFILTLLEVVREDLEFNNKNKFFVIPQMILKEVVDVFKVQNSVRLRPSLKVIMDEKWSHLSVNEKNKISDAKNDVGAIEALSLEGLDYMLDYWKFKNYQAKTKLPTKDKELMQKTYAHRAGLGSMYLSDYNFQSYYDESPHMIHGPHKLSLYTGPKDLTLEMAYGLHAFEDPYWGSDKNSFIDFFKFKIAQLHGGTNIEQIEIIDIKSLQDIKSSIFKPSWHVNVASTHRPSKEKIGIKGGLGLARLMTKSKSYIFANFLYNDSLIRDEKKIMLGPKFGFNYWLSDKFSINFDGESYLATDVKTLDLLFMQKINQNTWMSFGYKNHSLLMENAAFLGIKYYYF